MTGKSDRDDVRDDESVPLVVKAIDTSFFSKNCPKKSPFGATRS
jgi:hypothetical protein